MEPRQLRLPGFIRYAIVAAVSCSPRRALHFDCAGNGDASLFMAADEFAAAASWNNEL